MTPREWFTLPFWRNRGPDQHAVIDEWARLRALSLVMQDIALRGGVYSPLAVPAPGAALDPVTLAINEGRRQMALEIIKTAGLDPAELWRSIEGAQRKDRL